MSQTSDGLAPAIATAGHQREPKPLTYQQYYLRVIDQQRQAEDFAGLKPVIGPTGIGKTSPIPNVIAHLRAEGVENRCIYTSHRHLLIREMEDSLKKAKVPSVYLKSDEKVIEVFLTWREKREFLDRLDNVGFFEFAGNSQRAVEQQVESLQQGQSILKELHKQGFAEAYDQQRVVFQERCGQLLRVFKDGLSHREMPEAVHTKLMRDPGVWMLFPYVEFLYNPQRPVLLVTVQKLLFGFFDGCRNERLLSLKGNIIFLDEFDMQEKEMLSFLCRSPEIQNSFEFVRLFYEEMTRQHQLGHLDPAPNDTERQINAKQRALKIITDLQEDCTEEGFSFPQIRHFELHEGEFQHNSLSVFQSGVQIMTDPFYLRERDHVWEVVRQHTADTKRARPLMRVITQTANRILDFFSELRADELIPEWHSWIEQCYDQKNDNRPGRYKEIISDYGLYRRPSRLATERSDPAIADSIYYQGYNLFRLERGAYLTTPDEVRIDQKKLTVTPEYLLWRLSSSNLVFALSATGDIRRYIQSFDMGWLEQHGRYLPINGEDTALVAKLKRRKESKRSYEVKLFTANELSPSHVLSRALEQLVQEQFFNREKDEQASETDITYRKRALSLFLETLHWITHKSNNQAHLVFLNSFTFIEKLFRPDNGLPRSFYESISPCFQFRYCGENRAREYIVEIERRQCQVIFLDAAKGREMEDQTFHQILPDVPLIVVTTYPTASNGVNLKWQTHDDDGDAKSGRDLESIHLLEAPHYYFSGSDGNDDGIDKVKMFIWQVWKLYHNFQISEHQFLTALRELNISDVNSQYKSTPDYVLNQIAVFHQALGRIDRQWQQTPATEVRLASGKSGVLEIFDRYLTAPGVIAENRLAREAYTSSLILALYKQIEQQYVRREILNQLEFESIERVESSAQAITAQMLRMISGVRNGTYIPDDARKIMNLWWRIREAVLKQDYHFQSKINVTHLPTNQPQHLDVNFRRDFVHETAFLQNRQELLIDREQKTVHRQPTQSTRLYNLNRFYRRYADNSVIDWYFRTHNYQLRYEPGNQNLLFTPHIQQNILAGAVGEAALTAVFQHFDIPLTPEREYPPALFEIADMQLQGLPISIDAKNYSQWTTLYRFAATLGDPEYDEKLNAEAFLTAAQKKWEYIVATTGEQETKLVFINLVASEYHPNEGWDAQLNPVRPYSFADSAITIIQGVIDDEDPERWRLDFLSWVSAVKEVYSKQGVGDDKR